MRSAIERTLEREGQTVFLQWVRAIIALTVIGIASWREFNGESISETFAMVIGLVIGLYFEKGSMVVTQDRADLLPPRQPAEPEPGT